MKRVKHFTEGEIWADLNRRTRQPETVWHRYLGCLPPFDIADSALVETFKGERSVRLMFGWLAEQYTVCTLNGTGEKWERAAVATAALLASCADRNRAGARP